MAFQFVCPQGHLLEAEESHAGQQCQCPHCGMLFIIPAPAYHPHAAGGAAPSSPLAEEPAARFHFPGVGSGGAIADRAPFDPTGAPADTKLLHIPCPNGHELEAPPEMLGEDVLCPDCGVQFRLRERDSREFKRRREEEIQRAEDRAGRKWLNYAIVTAAVVVLGLVVMIVLSAMSGG